MNVSELGIAAPLVTVGVPTYNRSVSLRRTLDSLMAQDYPSLDIVVGDNASTDGTDDVERDFSHDARVRWNRRPRNVGPMRNFELVLEEARGQYFMWLADDDVISANYISACVAVLRADPHIALAVGHAVYIRAGEVVREEFRAYDQSCSASRLRAYYMTVEGNPFWSALMTTHQAQLNLPFRSPTIGMDWIYVARHLFSGSGLVVDAALIQVSLYAAEDPSKNDHSLGQGWHRTAFKMYFVARDAALDVLQHPTYAALRWPSRSVLAIEVAILVFLHLATRQNLYRAGTMTLRRLLPGSSYSYLRDRWRASTGGRA